MNEPLTPRAAQLVSRILDVSCRVKGGQVVKERVGVEGAYLWASKARSSEFRMYYFAELALYIHSIWLLCN